MFSSLSATLTSDRKIKVSLDCTRAHRALRWLEQLPPPAIRASIDADVDRPDSGKYWVPVNDDIVDAKVRPTPLVEQRGKRERFFPRAVPADPRVVFAWTGDDSR